MTIDSFTFRFDQIIADVDMSEEMIEEIFNLCTVHKLDLFTEELVYICKEYVASDFSDISLILLVEEDNPEIPSEYTAKLPDDLKAKFINDFKSQFCSFQKQAA